MSFLDNTKKISDEVELINIELGKIERIAFGLSLLKLSVGHDLSDSLDYIQESLEKIQELQRGICHGAFVESQERSASLLKTVLVCSERSVDLKEEEN